MMYSNDDINEMFQNLKSNLSEEMEEEIKYYVNMNGKHF